MHTEVRTPRIEWVTNEEAIRYVLKRTSFIPDKWNGSTSS